MAPISTAQVPPALSPGPLPLLAGGPFTVMYDGVPVDIGAYLRASFPGAFTDPPVWQWDAPDRVHQFVLADPGWTVTGDTLTGTTTDGTAVTIRPLRDGDRNLVTPTPTGDLLAALRETFPRPS